MKKKKKGTITLSIDTDSRHLPSVRRIEDMIYIDFVWIYDLDINPLLDECDYIVVKYFTFSFTQLRSVSDC